MMELLTADEMRAWDRRAIETLGIAERVLMESAGRAAARVVHHLYPSGRVVAVVGRGNNGGDAVVLLRSLRAWGREVAAVPVEGAELPEHLLHGWEIPVVRTADAAAALRDAAVIVDGILGTGARGAPRDAEAAAIRLILAAGRPVVALDGPTGVDLSDGSVPGEAVRAEVTLTFGAPKRGHLLFPGRAHAGRLLVLEVGFPPLRPDEAGAAVVTDGWANARYPRLRPNAHKGDAGMLGIVAGHPGMGGAAIMCAMGALRAGVGVVRVVSSAENRVAVQTAVPEALFVDRAGDGLDEALEALDAAVVGPGMGKEEDAPALLRRVLQRVQGPVLLDADAITLVAGDPALLPDQGRERLVLTPHPGEMGRLLRMEVPDVVADPFAAAAQAAERFRCTVLLKGAPSLVAAPREPVLASAAGHSGIAAGGMGDTLAGAIGALLAAGCPPRDATALGIFVAGRAAERAGLGRSLLPRDVAEALPGAIAALADPPRQGLPEVLFSLPAPW